MKAPLSQQALAQQPTFGTFSSIGCVVSALRKISLVSKHSWACNSSETLSQGSTSPFPDSLLYARRRFESTSLTKNAPKRFQAHRACPASQPPDSMGEVKVRWQRLLSTSKRVGLLHDHSILEKRTGLEALQLYVRPCDECALKSAEQSTCLGPCSRRLPATDAALKSSSCTAA